MSKLIVAGIIIVSGAMLAKELPALKRYQKIAAM